MKRFPPEIDPKIDTLTGVIIGYALIGNFNAVEQNAIGNWFMLVGQILETNAAFLQLNENRRKTRDEAANGPIISDIFESELSGNGENFNFENVDIERLEKMIRIMNEELEKIKRRF